MKTILVVDDDVDILDAVDLVLEEEGYQVIKTVNPEYAENIAQAEVLPDLIILDVFMSGNDGRDIVKKIKKNSDTKDIPILMISANPSVEKSTLEAGANFFLSKPFSLDTLTDNVSRLLS